MTDDLLDEATRYGERFKNVPVGVMVLDLVERVQQAEAERDDLALLVSEHRDALGRKHTYQQWLEAELDAALVKIDKARDKIDKVRALAETMQRAKVGGGFLSGSINTADVLAILDEKD